MKKIESVCSAVYPTKEVSEMLHLLNNSIVHPAETIAEFGWTVMLLPPYNLDLAASFEESTSLISTKMKTH
jgi:hypothetical protein